MDNRLEFSKLPSWLKAMNQALKGTELHTIAPISADPHTVYEYELPYNAMLLFGPMSGFLVTGTFESKQSAAANDSTFTQLTGDSASEVALAPNWFEHLISDLKVYQEGKAICANDVPRNADPFLNTYLYAHMHPDTKDDLFPEQCHPGRCVGLSDKDWSLTQEDGAWRKYGKIAFEKEEITFRYVPPFLFPFYQQTNFWRNGKIPTALPTHATGRMTVNLMLKEDRNNIFIKAEGNEKVYRFNIKKIHLVVEEARLNLSFQKKFLNRKDSLIYEGMSRIGAFENITPSCLTYRCKLENVRLPEGIFVCALPKTALVPNFKWTPQIKRVFKVHNVASISIEFDNKSLALRNPNLGEFRQHMMGIKQCVDYRSSPPFGVRQDRGINTFESLVEGCESTIYPHLYFNLTPSGKASRIIPINDEGQIISKQGELALTFNFKSGGAPANTIFLIYIFYSDINVIFDMKKKEFITLYKKTGGNS